MPPAGDASTGALPAASAGAGDAAPVGASLEGVFPLAAGETASPGVDFAAPDAGEASLEAGEASLECWL